MSVLRFCTSSTRMLLSSLSAFGLYLEYCTNNEQIYNSSSQKFQFSAECFIVVKKYWFSLKVPAVLWFLRSSDDRPNVPHAFQSPLHISSPFCHRSLSWLWWWWPNVTYAVQPLHHIPYCWWWWSISPNPIVKRVKHIILISIMIAGVFDRDAPADLLASKPMLYSVGRLSTAYK